MDEHLDFLDRLRRDLLEQFRGKPKIEVLQKALARQLEDIYEFYQSLNVKRWLKDAEGVQLDGVGDIVVMSRQDALVISKLANQNVPMDDDTYRTYLKWKNALNTTNCTHTDVYRALKMFWDKTPLYYSEDLAHPATIIFSTPALSPDQDAGILFLAPKVKAGGVALRIVATTETPSLETVMLGIAGVAANGIMTTTLPEYVMEEGFWGDMGINGHMWTAAQTALPQIEYD